MTTPLSVVISILYGVIRSFRLRVNIAWGTRRTCRRFLDFPSASGSYDFKLHQDIAAFQTPISSSKLIWVRVVNVWVEIVIVIHCSDQNMKNTKPAWSSLQSDSKWRGECSQVKKFRSSGLEALSECRSLFLLYWLIFQQLLKLHTRGVAGKSTVVERGMQRLLLINFDDWQN